MESKFICHLKHCCRKGSLVLVLLHVCLSKDCWIQPQKFSGFAPAAPRRVWNTVSFILIWFGVKKQIFANLQCLSFYSQPHFLSECRFDLSTSVLPQPCNEAVMEMLGNFMAGGHKGWSRPQKVHFAPELFKMKSLKHLFLLTVLEIYESVKTRLRCSVVSVTMLVEFR